MYNELIVKSKIRNYTVRFVEIEQIIESSNSANTITIIDENIKRLYPSLSPENSIVVQCNENAKTLAKAEELLTHFINNKVNIKTHLLVIGGGILQDLVGFCASIYCRGIDYTLVPTTLLAQTDSCVGGKTSINFFSKKNILGTFYPPKQILIYSGFINTLSTLDFLSGLGEIYKFHLLQNTITNFDYITDINAMIYESLRYKIDIINVDEFDKKERKFLNYGHTFGHALESLSNYDLPHGIAVILGCMIATVLAHKLGYIVTDYETRLAKGIELIHKSGIKLQSEWFNCTELLKITKLDKKSTG
ncbi:hypothetical protein EBU95_18960, partial [bacterium]|nr:hypothetical protein [bacterium]